MANYFVHMKRKEMKKKEEEEEPNVLVIFNNGYTALILNDFASRNADQKTRITCMC